MQDRWSRSISALAGCWTLYLSVNSLAPHPLDYGTPTRLLVLWHKLVVENFWGLVVSVACSWPPLFMWVECIFASFMWSLSVEHELFCSAGILLVEVPVITAFVSRHSSAMCMHASSFFASDIHFIFDVQILSKGSAVRHANSLTLLWFFYEVISSVFGMYVQKEVHL